MTKVEEKIKNNAIDLAIQKAGLADYIAIYQEKNFYYVYVNNFNLGYASLTIIKNEETVGDFFCQNANEINLDDKNFDFFSLEEVQQIKYLENFIL